MTYFQISDHYVSMPRRRPGSLLPLEVSILAVCREARIDPQVGAEHGHCCRQWRKREHPEAQGVGGCVVADHFEAGVSGPRGRTRGDPAVHSRL